MGSEFLTRQEKARLVSMGEQLSALKICSELLDMGIRAYALPFFDCGILTDENYDYAKVLKPVSYTHLDVYKRQAQHHAGRDRNITGVKYVREDSISRLSFFCFGVLRILS